ncbi:hypothetical protein FDP41_008041 [Naegleria fowleri]|uniref:Uncharacterized protein n=1 Tax=Naegleria fowleri TaxID=5763 RepID=A0A6A5C8N9_NAEFO|nr:uncharacterized protein FDP41_008041 [Naegleria fowleri]KAF0984126.1 hypothetical protein FDP41_008041 [Naegleria fowleri]
MMTPPTLICTNNTTNITTTTSSSLAYKEPSPSATAVDNRTHHSESSPTSTNSTISTPAHRISHGSGSNGGDDDDSTCVISSSSCTFSNQHTNNSTSLSNSVNTSNSMLSRKRASHGDQLHDDDEDVIDDDQDGFTNEDQEGTLMMMMDNMEMTMMNRNNTHQYNHHQHHNSNNNHNSNSGASIDDILKGLASQRSTSSNLHHPFLPNSSSSSVSFNNNNNNSITIPYHPHHDDPNQHQYNNQVNVRKHSSPNNLFFHQSTHNANNNIGLSNNNAQTTITTQTRGSSSSSPTIIPSSQNVPPKSSSSPSKKKKQQQQKQNGETLTISVSASSAFSQKQQKASIITPSTEISASSLTNSTTTPTTSTNRKLSLSVSIQKRISSWRSNHKNSNPTKSNKKQEAPLNQQQSHKHSRSHSESLVNNLSHNVSNSSSSSSIVFGNEESTVLLVNSAKTSALATTEKSLEKSYGTVLGSSSSLSTTMEDLHHSSNSQMQSLKSILAQNKFRHHQNNYECVDSDESPVTSASTVEPLSPFPSNNQHNGQNIHNNLGFGSPPKLIIPNVASSTNESCESYQNQHSQLKPKKLDFSIDLSSVLDNDTSSNQLRLKSKLAPLTARARGDSSIKHPFDYLKGSVSSHQPSQPLAIPVVLTRKRSLPTTPEFLSMNSHNKKSTPRDEAAFSNNRVAGQQSVSQQSNLSTTISLTTPHNTKDDTVLVSSLPSSTNSPNEEQGIHVLSIPVLTITTTAPTEHQIVIEKPKQNFMTVMSADTLILVSSFIYDDNYEKQIENFSFLTSHDIFTTLMLVCRAWYEKLNEDLVWSFRYRQFLNNLLKHYSKSVNAYFVTYGNEKHPLQRKNSSTDFDKKYTPIHKRYKFLKNLQKEMNNFKPPAILTTNANASLTTIGTTMNVPNNSNHSLSVRRGTIAHLKPGYNMDSTTSSTAKPTDTFRKRTSSNAELTSPRFEDLPKFAAFGGTTPRTPVALTNFSSPRKHAHSSVSLSNVPPGLKPVGFHLFTDMASGGSGNGSGDSVTTANNSKISLPLSINKNFTFKEKFMDLLRDEYCSNVRIALRTMNPLKFIKCLIIEDETLSRMQFYYHIHLFYALKLFIDGAKKVIHSKDKSDTSNTPETSNLSSVSSSTSSLSSKPNRFVQEVLRTSSATLFSIILSGLKDLKHDLALRPQNYPEFYKEVKNIQNFTSVYSASIANQVAYIAEKLTTRYFLIIFDKLNPPINFDVLKSFMTAYPSIADNKLLLIVLDRARETFFHSPMEGDSFVQPFSSGPLSTLAASKQNRVEFAFLQFLVENVLPIIAREKADSRRIIDLLMDILTSRYSLNLKELCAYYRHLSGEALSSGHVTVDPYFLLVVSCFKFSQHNSSTLSNIDTTSSFNSSVSSSSKYEDDVLVHPQFFEYLIDKFEIDVNRKEILFFLLKHKQTLPYLEALKKAGKIDIRFVHRCFHSKHFAEFLTKLYYSGSVGPYQCLDTVLQQFNIDPLADFESENSFKSLEEAWKSSINTTRSLTRSYGSTKNKDNFLKIISRIEAKQNGYSATYHVNLLKIFKVILRRCKEQDKKFNLQKIDRDMKISFNFITHSFLTDLGHYHESNYRNTTLEMCELLIGSANALIDCSVLKFILQRIEVEDATIRGKNSKQIAYYYQNQNSELSHTSIELEHSGRLVDPSNNNNNTQNIPNWYNKSELALMSTVTKAMELLLQNSAMISKLTSFNTSGSKLASSMFTDIMPYSEWYSQHKLANDHSPHAAQYLQLYERTRLFIARYNFNAALVEKEMNDNQGISSCCVIL